MVASSRTAMAFEITGHKPGLEGAFVRTQAHTAADALRFAREWAEQGLTGITIVNPKGESYDIDRFRYPCDSSISTAEPTLPAMKTASSVAPTGNRCSSAKISAASAERERFVIAMPLSTGFP